MYATFPVNLSKYESIVHSLLAYLYTSHPGGRSGIT